MTRFLAKVVPEPNTGCYLWEGGVSEDGYGHFWLEGRTTKAHRFAWESKYGPIPDGLQICHKCDTPACTNPDHMFLGTALDNAIDREGKGRANRPRGSAHRNSRLTEGAVVYLRQQAHNGVPQVTLARTLGVSEATVSLVLSGKRWAHVKTGPNWAAL